MGTPSFGKPDPTAYRSDPTRPHSHVLYVVSIAAEGVLILGILAVLVYSIAQVINLQNTSKADLLAHQTEVASLNTDNDNLQQQLTNTSDQLNSANDLAVQNAEKASQNDQKAAQFEQKALDFEKKNKELTDNLAKANANLQETSWKLTDLTSKNETLQKNYQDYLDMTAKYNDLKKSLTCTDYDMLQNPDYTSNETLKTALIKWVEDQDGPVKKSLYEIFFDKRKTSIHKINGQDYFWVFIVNFESDNYPRNTVYLVHAQCFLDYGGSQP
jgi:hypothetical protein